MDPHHGRHSRARSLVTPKHPRGILPILDDGRGGHYYVVCRKRGEQESAEFGQVYYNPGDSRDALEYTASDFYSFVVSLADELCFDEVGAIVLSTLDE